MNRLNRSAIAGAFRAEVLLLSRSRLFLALTVVQSVAFLLLVSIFGITGSRAPVAVVLEDQGEYAHDFLRQLGAAHHSFSIRSLSRDDALRYLRAGRIVAIITIPRSFTEAVLFGKETSIRLDVDNIDTDMTDDVQRALPSAIVAFGRAEHLPGIRADVSETDLVDHETGFIPYLLVSGLVLDAFVIAGILGAMTVAREYESGTLRVLASAPPHPAVPIIGRAAASGVAAAAILLAPLAIVVFAYGVRPAHPAYAVGTLLACSAIFSCLGVALGAVLKRTLPVAALVLGMAMPLYVCSGSLEPARFDGERVWLAAHVSPVYYGVGILEYAFHDLRVTPESLAQDEAALAAWGLAMLVFAGTAIRRRVR